MLRGEHHKLKTSKKLFAKCKRNEFIQSVSLIKVYGIIKHIVILLNLILRFITLTQKKNIFNYTPQLIDERYN